MAPTAASAEQMEILDYARTQALSLVRDTCFAQHANATTIAAELQARGWRQLSETERQQRDPENVGYGFIMHWTTSQAWAPPEDSVVMLALGEGPVDEGHARAEFCMVLERRGFSQQASVIRRWLGFRRFQSWGPGGEVFAYLRDPEDNISNGAELADEVRLVALREGRLGFVQIVGDQTTSVVNFSVLHPSPP
ncbi:MAG: hypothetical protein NT015_17265 [Alphaproteobacteria bacterium]|nr:hypothetical protein [Alphaproteobacteria bacterium]